MLVRTKLAWGCLGALSLLSVTGCLKVRPPVTEVEGRVMLNGQPLPNAQVVFMPELERYGAEMNSVGETDGEGRFRLTCAYQQQPGACVGTHRVLVTDPPARDEFRSQSQQAQEAYMKYLRSLKNRPIPAAYGNVGKTPLRVEVKADQKSYEISLSR
ncbi:MAG TPA: hypothetical protein VFE78_40045 [Gemmataceae bacterium]|nr:hypothetical protein [Gemmataceae bacterium]